MPILTIHIWSHFLQSDAADIPGCAGSAVFEGGDTQTLLLSETEGAGLTLDQAAHIDGVPYLAGTGLRVSGTATTAQGGKALVLSLGDAPVGVTRPETPLAPGDEVTFSPSETDDRPDTEPHQGLICFATGTQLATPDGPRRVETLRPGEKVLTADHGPQPVLWTGRREVLFKRHDNRHRPILFRAGSLGPGQPARDLIVSPDHRMILAGPDIVAQCGTPEVLAPAGALIGLPKVRPMLGKRRVTYVNVLLKSHAVLDAEGAGAESFLPDTAALAALGDAQRSALFGVKPELRTTPECEAPARPCLDADAARELVVKLKSGGRGAPPVTKTEIAAE